MIDTRVETDPDGTWYVIIVDMEGNEIAIECPSEESTGAIQGALDNHALLVFLVH